MTVIRDFIPIDGFGLNFTLASFPPVYICVKSFRTVRALSISSI